MPQEQFKRTEWTCRACGFRIFNRRYPKCEHCKADLPASLVYSEQERRALLASEEEQLRRTAIGAPASTTQGGGTAGTLSTPDSFASGGGVFDVGGASGSFGGESGSSSGSD